MSDLPDPGAANEPEMHDGDIGFVKSRLALLPSFFQIGDDVRVVSFGGVNPVEGVLFEAGKTSYKVRGVFFPAEEVLLPRLREVKP